LIPVLKTFLFICLALMTIVMGAQAATSLQVRIDLTPAGSTLRPLPGTYTGPVFIDKPIIIDGQNKVVLDGLGKGSVMVIRCDGVEVRNMRITGSGRSHDQVDAGVLINADHVIFENNTIDNALFGVHVSQGDHNIIRGNTISSLIDRDATLRGEGVRLWYSQQNIIQDNIIFRVRDMVLANSPFNKILDNEISDSRMGMELIFSHAVEISGNTISDNENGIIGIYSDSLYIHHNRIQHQSTLRGSAIAVKASSQTRIEDNEILDCAIGMTANSPIFPENILYIRRNKFVYNDVAMFFYGDRGGHVIEGNQFIDNHQQVSVTGPTSAIYNKWLGNYWQDYNGFDMDGDGIGDKPYTAYLYSDRIWMDRPMAKFFRGSPMLDVLDFVERLAPFSEVDMILQDPEPRMWK
jgi:nitrous oxidase accessory protein